MSNLPLSAELVVENYLEVGLQNNSFSENVSEYRPITSTNIFVPENESEIDIAACNERVLLKQGFAVRSFETHVKPFAENNRQKFDLIFIAAFRQTCSVFDIRRLLSQMTDGGVLVINLKGVSKENLDYIQNIEYKKEQVESFYLIYGNSHSRQL